MKKLPLIISYGKMMKKNLVVEKRLFYKTSFKSLNKILNTEMLSSLERIGSNVREIEFSFCHFPTAKIFLDILRNFPKVEKITIIKCFLFSSEQLNHHLLILDYLKEIEMDKSYEHVNYDFNQLINCI